MIRCDRDVTPVQCSELQVSDPLRRRLPFGWRLLPLSLNHKRLNQSRKDRDQEQKNQRRSEEAKDRKEERAAVIRLQPSESGRHATNACEAYRQQNQHFDDQFNQGSSASDIPALHRFSKGVDSNG